MFRVVSDWLHSLSVAVGQDMSTKVLVLSTFHKNGGTVFFFAKDELLQHIVYGFGSFR